MYLFFLKLIYYYISLEDICNSCEAKHPKVTHRYNELKLTNQLFRLSIFKLLHIKSTIKLFETILLITWRMTVINYYEHPHIYKIFFNFRNYYFYWWPTLLITTFDCITIIVSHIKLKLNFVLIFNKLSLMIFNVLSSVVLQLFFT